VDRVISENLVLSNLWEQALTPLQLSTLEDHLQQVHPELYVSHKIWRREIDQAMGTAMQVGETKKLANSYLACLTKDQ
jgi:hypothetical protein